ncbi:MAG: hypothetical protein FJ088_07685, partial [Deltaproteobacteria bacterium]|nr:hypothetical protein [Deltaproteobacteria bacterium]
NLSEDQSERYKYLMKCAEIKLEKTGETASALELLKEAANIKQDSRATLHLLLSAAVEAHEFGQAFDALVRILNIEESGIKKAQYHFTSAMLARDNLNDEALAVEHLEQALLYNPDYEEAAAALEGIFQKNADYSRLAEMYRRCYKNAQMKGETEKIRACLSKLTDLYHDKLGNIPQAAAYYEEMLALSPGDAGLMKTLCAIYERDPVYADKALSLNTRMMQIDKNLPGHIRAIRRIFSDKGDTDAVWCASGALAVLNEADEQEREFFEKYRIPALKLKKASFDEEMFNNQIRSREDDLLVGEVFSLIYPHLGNVIPWKTPADFGFTESNVLDLSKRSHFNDIVLAACKILVLPAPRIFFSEDRAGFIKMPVYPAALAVGGDIVNEKRGKELRFIVGRMLTTLFPLRILAWIADVRTLRAIFVASLKLVFPEFPVDPADAEVKHFAAVFRDKLPDETKKKMLDLLTKYRKERKEINLLAWENGVELTSDRVGFVLANDIEVSVKMIREEKVQLGALDAEQRIDDLIQYSVSENYLRLRKIIF